MDSFFPSEVFNDFFVGLVDDAVVEGGQVDEGGGWIVVAHGLADDCQWYVHALGDAGPGMSGDVHGECVG